MVNLIIIGLIVLFVFLFFKITSFRYERWWTYLIAILMIFLLFSFFSVVKNNNIDIKSVDGFFSGAKVYVSWLVGFGKNAASITGQVTKIDWNATGNATFDENRDVFLGQYTEWLSQLFNHGAVVVGYVVGNQWLPDVPGNAGAG